MGAVAAAIRTLLEGILMPFDWMGPFWGLTLFSLASGVFMLWVVGKTTPQKRIESSRNKMASAIYEIRLFLDSPKRVLISLGRLLYSSFAYVGWMLPAFVVLILPLGLLYLHLEVRHGLDALPTGRPFVVAVDLAEGAKGRSLKVPGEQDGLEITAPPVVVEDEGRAFLRVVAREKGVLKLRFEVEGATVTKSIVTDPEALQMAPERSSESGLWLSFGSEERLDGPVSAISVLHPARDTRYLGIAMPWWVYWMVLSMVAAFGLRKPMKVAI